VSKVSKVSKAKIANTKVANMTSRQRSAR
jgi:hypothetical protein